MRLDINLPWRAFASFTHHRRSPRRMQCSCVDSAGGGWAAFLMHITHSVDAGRHEHVPFSYLHACRLRQHRCCQEPP
jgi:hypothetical protein